MAVRKRVVYNLLNLLALERGGTQKRGEEEFPQKRGKEGSNPGGNYDIYYILYTYIHNTQYTTYTNC